MEEKNQAPAAPKAESTDLKGGGPVGLDIGTSRIVVADGPEGSRTRTQLNAFVPVPVSEMAENMLRQRGMVYEKNCKNLFVYGNDSEFFASFLDTDARRPMCTGLLNPQEANSQQMIQNIIKLMVPRARRGEVLCFSAPGKGEGVSGNLVYHEAVLKQFLQTLGYTVKPLNEGQAVVFSELQSENFTGVGISFGGGMCNVSVSFMSMPMITFSVPKGGDYIDRNVAEVMGESNTTKVRLFKEEKLDLSRPARDEMTQALHIFYEDVMRTLIDRLRSEFSRSGQLPKVDRPMAVVLAGGTARPAGFLEKFESLLRADGEFPIPLSEVRMASDPLSATARGCYIAAQAEMK
jgi:hypothetical protein